jgi:hypothetical protein
MLIDEPGDSFFLLNISSDTESKAHKEDGKYAGYETARDLYRKIDRGKTKQNNSGGSIQYNANSSTNYKTPLTCWREPKPTITCAGPFLVLTRSKPCIVDYASSYSSG